MSWIKLSEELYLSDQSPYSLEKIDGIWYVVDNSTQKKSIPFTDIFNNPVFPVDYSNTNMIVKSLTSPGVIEGKHFRGESANTPGTPAFSFQGDIDTGFFRKSANVMGISSGGVEVSEINNFGVLNGTPGTDFRNLIKRQFGQIGTGSPNCTSSSILSSGFGFSYTPLRSDSFLNIRFFLTTRVSYGSIGVNNTNSGFLYIYSHTSIPSGGTTALGTQKNKYFLGYAGLYSTYAYENVSHSNFNLLELSGNTNARSYYLGFNNGISNGSTSFNPNNDPSINMGYIIEEYI